MVNGQLFRLMPHKDPRVLSYLGGPRCGLRMLVLACFFPCAVSAQILLSLDSLQEISRTDTCITRFNLMERSSENLRKYVTDIPISSWKELCLSDHCVVGGWFKRFGKRRHLQFIPSRSSSSEFLNGSIRAWKNGKGYQEIEFLNGELKRMSARAENWYEILEYDVVYRTGLPIVRCHFKEDGIVEESLVLYGRFGEGVHKLGLHSVGSIVEWLRKRHK